MFKEFLQGRPIGHPLHSAIVHVPIALFLASFVFDVIALVRNSAVLGQAAFYTMSLGIVSALVAAVPGFADWTDIRRDHPARRLANYHMWLNLAAVGAYAISVYLRFGDRSSPPGSIPFMVSALGITLIGVSGYIGGTLIYNHGVGVGRHDRQTETPTHTIRLSNKNGDGGFFVVAELASLEERGTLRAEVAGHVMSIARIDGRVYAFQDFCTHRFGPLSEGTFRGHEVICPWHRSCFDVRTGRVTQGPAKVDLKTFEVEVRDGQICVRIPGATR